MTNLTGNWKDQDGFTGSIQDDNGKLTLSPGNAPWTKGSYGAWGQSSAKYDGKGNPNAGCVAFTYGSSPLTTDTESFTYDPSAGTLTFGNGRIWTKQ